MSLEITFAEPITQWDWKIGQYIALIGVAAGAYLTAYAADVLSTRNQSLIHGRIAQYGYLAGLGIIAISPLIMLSHLATPFRAMMLPLTMSNLGSWMAIGSYLLAGFGLGAFLMFAWTAFGKGRPNAPAVSDGGDDVATDGGEVASDGGTADTATGGRTTGVRSIASSVGLLDKLDTIADKTRPSGPVRLGIGAIFAVFAAGVLLYSAMALGSGSTNRVPLWDKTFLIPVQMLGGLGAGMALSIGFAAITEGEVGETMKKYALVSAVLLAGSLLAIAATVLALDTPGVANMLEMTWLFIVGSIVVGLLIPIGLQFAAAFDAVSAKAAAGSLFAAGVLAVVGKLALAMTYLLAAEFTPLPLPV